MCLALFQVSEGPSIALHRTTGDGGHYTAFTKSDLDKVHAFKGGGENHLCSGLLLEKIVFMYRDDISFFGPWRYLTSLCLHILSLGKKADNEAR